MGEFKLNRIEEAIDDIRQGKVVIVVDDEDRENEGDFICAAECITPEIVNFMATHGRGLICAPLVEDRCEELGLELMSDDLVVLVPEKEKQYNGIPYASLVTRMEEKAKGRVFFSADSNYPPNDVLKKKPAGLSKEEWTAFKKDIVIEDLYIEYTVRG